MTFPRLIARKKFARVEIRVGRGADGWDQLAVLYTGSCNANKAWSGEEGEKLAARHCLWPSDPDSTMSQPYLVSGVEGLGEGVPVTLEFPSGV
jgi:hypothetical protein